MSALCKIQSFLRYMKVFNLTNRLLFSTRSLGNIATRFISLLIWANLLSEMLGSSNTGTAMISAWNLWIVLYFGSKCNVNCCYSHASFVEQCRPARLNRSEQKGVSVRLSNALPLKSLPLDSFSSLWIIL